MSRRVLAVFAQVAIVTGVVDRLDGCHRRVRMIGQPRGRIVSRIRVVQAVQVGPLDGFVLTELRQSLRYGEPLSFPTNGARIFPFWQFLGYPHNPHLRSVLVFGVLKR